MNEGASCPKLSIGQAGELNPAFFGSDIRGLQLGHQEMLLAKTNALFEVKSLPIGLISLTIPKLPTFLTKNNQPLGREEAQGGGAAISTCNKSKG